MRPIQWLKCQVEGEIASDGRITARLEILDMMETSRPKTAADLGADPAVLERINQRRPGPFRSLVRPGCGIGIFCDTYRLVWPAKPLVDKLNHKYGGNYGHLALVGFVRNTGAGGSWNALDPCAGVPTTPDLTLAALLEAAEALFVNEEGWLGYFLPLGLTPYQDAITKEQSRIARLVVPGQTMAMQGQLDLMPLKQDYLDGQHCILSTDSSGSLEIITPMVVNLPPHTNWRVLDGEDMKVRGRWKPMRRKGAIICPRLVLDGGKAPMLFTLNRVGVIDDYGLHASLEGENLELLVNDKIRSLMMAVGWIA